jgi:hypothetical protein
MSAAPQKQLRGPRAQAPGRLLTLRSMSRSTPSTCQTPRSTALLALSSMAAGWDSMCEFRAQNPTCMRGAV